MNSIAEKLKNGEFNKQTPETKTNLQPKGYRSRPFDHQLKYEEDNMMHTYGGKSNNSFPCFGRR